MEEKKLTIQVIGQSNTGKTTVAHIIKTALEEQGFQDVELHDIESETPNKEHILKRVEVTKTRPIRIEVLTISRSPKSREEVK
jgi:MinD superfamily P-loop ATPase